MALNLPELRGTDLLRGGTFEELPEIAAKSNSTLLPPPLRAGPMEKPEQIVAMAEPKVVVDHAGLILEIYILVAPEKEIGRAHV